MDYHKKKLLTQSVAFLQANLSLTTGFLTALHHSNVLTAEEISTIQKDETTSGKVLELLCMLKRKDNRTYNHFLDVLEEQQCTSVLHMLRSKAAPSDVLPPDPRIVYFLETQLGAAAAVATKRTLSDMAVSLVLKEIHEDEMQLLQEKLRQLQQLVKGREKPAALRSDSSSSSLEDSPTQTPAPALAPPTPAPVPLTPIPASRPGTGMRQMSSRSRSVPKWDVPSPQQELEVMLRNKDEVIRKKDEEYGKLRTILVDTQADLQSVLDLNSQYLTIISQLNQMQVNANQTPRFQEKSEMVMGLERDLEEAQAKVEELNVQLDAISDDLASKEKELAKVLRRDKKYKEMLDLPEDAPPEEVEQRIQEIVESGSMHKLELDKIKRELQKISDSKVVIQERLTTLTREKDKVDFHLRQQDLTMKRMKRMKAGSEAVKHAETLLQTEGGGTAASRLPTIVRESSQIALTKAERTGGSHRYCMFCRQEYQTAKSQACRVHFRPIRGGKWTCCKDDCHRSVGCLNIPHFFVEITVDKKVFLTDGARYMELS